MTGAGSLEINLYNFEDDEFAESPYVLTSPRSLQACDMLGVKPAHLLYKPLADFQDELLSTGLPLRAIYDEYDEHEKLRQRQLRECRDYRDKMIGDRVQHMMSSSAQKFIPCHTLSYEDAGYKSDESHYSSKKLHAASDGEIPQNEASLQRQRTAKVIRDGIKSSSRAHSPVPVEYSLISRPHSALAMTSSSEPKEVGPRSCSVTPTKSVSFTGRGSHARKSSRSKSLTNNTSRGHSMRDLYKQPQRRDHSSYLTPSKSIRTAWTSSRLDDEYDEISDKLSTSLCLSDLSTWRSADLKGTHLKNKSLRRSLGYDNSSGRVTHRDEKILEALHAKNEREVELERSRSEAQLAWEEERMQLNHQKDLLENRRRQLLAHRIADAEEQQTLLKERQHRDEEVVRQRMLTKCQLKDASWRHSSDQQQLRRDLALTEKRRRSLNRKLSQERLLSEFERQRENELTKHQHQRENQRMRASMMKDHKYFSDREKKRKENEEEVQQHERRLKGLERMSKKFNESLRNSISEKAAKSLRNQVAVANSRDYNMHMNAKERQRKFYKSKRNQQKMEEEIGDWHRSLKTRRQFLDSKAKLTASQMVEIKALNAREERRDREDRQQKTYRKLQEEAEQNCRDQKDAIKYKNTKMKLVQHHRDTVTGKVRSLAASSQRMREELRRRYGKDSFDKVVLETELRNKIGSGHISATKNKSTVILA